MPPSRSSWSVRLLVLGVLVAPAWLPGGPALAQDAGPFAGLQVDRPVYDRTGSLTPAQVADLETRIADVRAAGADVVVWVRALDADPDETFDQVEALQQAWVRQTGADEDTAAAVLVNRNPDDPTDARAGVFVGRTLAEGNIDEDEQRAIVEDALVPPLREGDVATALAAALDRLGGSIRNGPPVSAFDAFAASAARTWLPWTALVVAAAGLAGALLLFGRRSRPGRVPAARPTTRRPGDLPPALAGALVGGGPGAGTVPAVLLDLAGRGAVAVEAESEGGWGSSPKVRVRLVDRGPVRDDVERAVWDRLAELADGGVVDSGGLTELSGSTGPVHEAVRAELRRRGWLDPRAPGAQLGLTAIGAVALLGAIAAAVLAGAGGGPPAAWIGVAALVVVAVVAFWFLAVHPTLTTTGQEAAAPWTAYRDGLQEAAGDDRAPLDLDTVLPDAVAMGIGDALGDRIEAATGAGVPLRAFGAAGPEGSAHLATFPWWIAFTSSTAGATSSTTTVSGGGAGGGGGAAGST